MNEAFFKMGWNVREFSLSQGSCAKENECQLVGQVLDLAWNLQGELVSVSTNGIFAEGYAYDPTRRRIATTDANGTVYHAYDGIHCVADLAPDGTLLRSYTWGSGVDIKRAQSPRRSRRATAILSPSRRDGAGSGIPRRSGNCYLLAVTFYSAVETNTLYAVTDPLGTVHALVAKERHCQFNHDCLDYKKSDSRKLQQQAVDKCQVSERQRQNYENLINEYRMRLESLREGR